jgi:hypothetical protein
LFLAKSLILWMKLYHVSISQISFLLSACIYVLLFCYLKLVLSYTPSGKSRVGQMHRCQHHLTQFNALKQVAPSGIVNASACSSVIARMWLASLVAEPGLRLECRQHHSMWVHYHLGSHAYKEMTVHRMDC